MVSCCSCAFVFGQAGGGEAAEPVGAKLWIDSAAIDLGFIAVGEQEIEGVIPYMNDGDETLEVTNIVMLQTEMDKSFKIVNLLWIFMKGICYGKATQTV